MSCKINFFCSCFCLDPYRGKGFKLRWVVIPLCLRVRLNVKTTRHDMGYNRQTINFILFSQLICSNFSMLNCRSLRWRAPLSVFLQIFNVPMVWANVTLCLADSVCPLNFFLKLFNLLFLLVLGEVFFFVCFFTEALIIYTNPLSETNGDIRH